MSDTQHPEESTGQPPHSPPARNMADIARLFLDGARPTGPGAPRRTPPTAPARRQPPSAQPQKSPTDKALLHLAIGGAIAQGDTGWHGLRAAAAALAHEHATTVAILGFHSRQWIIEIAGADSVDDLPTVRPEPTGNVDLQIARALFTLRPAVGLWLIAAPAAGTSEFTALAARIPQWLVVCPTDNDGLVATYQQLKRAAVIPPAPSEKRSVHAFMAPGPAADPAAVHARLNRAAREFLGTELPLLRPSPDPAEPRRVAAFPAANIPAIWTALLDELAPGALDPETDPEIASESLPRPAAPLDPRPVEDALQQVSHHVSEIARTVNVPFDHLGHVLDAEERQALAAAFDPLPEPPAPIRPARPATPPTPLPQNPARSAPVAAPPKPAPADLIPSAGTLVLRAFDLLEAEAADRAAQWQAVERSIRDFVPNATLLEARPPMSWAGESTLAVDTDGRLHVWTLFRDGASWFALREWATEHRGILALTRRDLILNHDAQVAVHIVMPLDSPSATPAADTALPRAAAPHVSWYRLRAIQWAGRRGALVVPAQ
ncbi:MAG TPA: hypothetical protein VH253_09540 [Phycisphaerae bacterium]|nr:hypothetical protein [Phycisphaerae bacterium]